LNPIATATTSKVHLEFAGTATYIFAVDEESGIPFKEEATVVDILGFRVGAPEQGAGLLVRKFWYQSFPVISKVEKHPVRNAWNLTYALENGGICVMEWDTDRASQGFALHCV